MVNFIEEFDDPERKIFTANLPTGRQVSGENFPYDPVTLLCLLFGIVIARAQPEATPILHMPAYAKLFLGAVFLSLM